MYSNNLETLCPECGKWMPAPAPTASTSVGYICTQCWDAWLFSLAQKPQDKPGVGSDI